ncbi:hypothetical protein [Acidiplasma cupricumulans]|jgi:hypothetical protein|uniref:hypothetical protein n=1 Tax=Acidiplasma cupricumulans TaxID=312540 RepID=UPI000780430F|nr:hypothetical protein [Acidiplasma cupricumulans]
MLKNKGLYINANAEITMVKEKIKINNRREYIKYVPNSFWFLEKNLPLKYKIIGRSGNNSSNAYKGFKYPVL